VILLALFFGSLFFVWWTVFRSSTVTVVNRTNVPIAFAVGLDEIAVIGPCSTRTFDGSPYYIPSNDPVPSGAFIFYANLMDRAWSGDSSGRMDGTLVLTPTFVGVPAQDFKIAGGGVAPSAPESVPCSGAPPSPSSSMP